MDEMEYVGKFGGMLSLMRIPSISPCNRGGFLFLETPHYWLETTIDTWHHCRAESCLDALFSRYQSAIVFRIHHKSNVNFVYHKTTYIPNLITTA